MPRRWERESLPSFVEPPDCVCAIWVYCVFGYDSINHTIMSNLRAFLGQYKKEIILGLILFLVASLSFGLGYVASGQFNRAPIVIEKCSDLN